MPVKVVPEDANSEPSSSLWRTGRLGQILQDKGSVWNAIRCVGDLKVDIAALPVAKRAWVRAEQSAFRGRYREALAHVVGAEDRIGDGWERVAFWACACSEKETAEEALSAIDENTATAALLKCMLEEDDRGAEASLDSLACVLTSAREQQDAQTQWKTLHEMCRLEQKLELHIAADRHKSAALEVLDAMAMSLPPDRRAAFWTEAQRKALWGTAKATPIDNPSERKGVRLVFELLGELAEEHDLDVLLERITQGAVELSGAEQGFVLLLDENGQWVQATIANAARKVGQELASFSRSIAETVLIDGEKLITLDAQEDPRIAGHQSVHSLRLRSVACLPIRTRDRVVGVLYLEHRGRRGRFLQTDMALLEAFASQGGRGDQHRDHG